MATTDLSHGADSHHISSWIQAAPIPIIIYIAAYFAAWGILHVLTSPDAAAAIAPASSMAPVAAAASSPRFGLAESPSADSRSQVQERMVSPRECRPSVGIDSNCTYN